MRTFNINGCEVPVDGNTIRRTKVEALSPILVNSYEKYTGNALLFANKGNTVVTYDDNWTIPPGEFLEVANPGTYDLIDQRFDFKFGTVNVVDALPISNKIEVLRMYYVIENI